MKSLVPLGFLCLAGCGYVGPVLPPSPQIPPTITDLAAVERGDQIILSFTAPARTADGVAITKFSSIELRVQPGDKIISIDLPSPSDRDDPQTKAISQKIPIAPWTGQHILLSVRTAVRKSGHFSDWSKDTALDVLPALESPVVHAASSPNGIDLTWEPVPGLRYRVNRQGPADQQPLQLSDSVEGGHYADSFAQYGTEYRYSVTAVKGTAESLPSKEIAFTAIDTFAPAVPTGLSIVAGADAIDLAWQRNSEPDLQGYYIYRSVNGGPYQRQGAVVTLPTYIDHSAEHGKTYSYKVSAVDKKNNESAQSVAVEAQY